MEADLYDEFGNYIGPEIESDEESEDDDEVGEEEAVEYVSWEDALEQFCRELKMYGPICIDACRFQNVMKTSTLPSPRVNGSKNSLFEMRDYILRSFDKDMRDQTR